MGIFDFFKKNKNIINYKDGLNEIYYNNGKGKLKERYYNKDRQKDGLYQLYYEDGKTIKEERNYRPGSTDDLGWTGNSIKIGLHKTYYKNGKIESITDHDLGPDESYKQYFEETGQIECEYNKEENFKKVYYNNGQIKTERKWDSVYPIKEYFKDGVLKSVKNLVHTDERSHEEYYENGNLYKKIIKGSLRKVIKGTNTKYFDKYQYFDKQGELINEKEEMNGQSGSFNFDEHGNKIYL